MSLKNIAVFGGSGQLGRSILTALIHCKKQSFNPIAVIPPKEDFEPIPGASDLDIRKADLLNTSQSDLKHELKGIDTIVSALNGKALEAQPTIQDAAAEAGVKRFYPSEYGFHNFYRKPDSDWAYVHPMWDLKTRLNGQALLHPAIDSGKMTYTMIGCGDFYNQGREPVWCPWTQKNPKNDTYELHVIGSPDEKADYTHIDDFARYLVATLCEPERSANKHFDFVSDTVSQKEIAELLENYTGKKVELDVVSENDQHRIVADPDSAPDELKESAFPVDFWFLVKGAQGKGQFRRPKGEVHNHLFPDVKTTSFESFFRERFGSKAE